MVRLLLTVFIVLAFPLARASHIVMDLSLPLPKAANYNNNQGAAALYEAKASDVLGFAVLKDGLLVAGAEPASVENIHSVTKTWVATLIGVMVNKGILNVSMTLETALPRVDWNAVQSGSSKKHITIAQMLSMSSGLRCCEDGCYEFGPQSTVEEVLDTPMFIASRVGYHFYLCSGSILSYVIFQLTGKTPLQYAKDELFPYLGIAEEVTWTPAHGKDQIHETGGGMVLGTLELAKLGAFYLQDGLTGPDGVQLLSEAYVNASVTDHLTAPIPADFFSWLGSGCVFKSGGAGYGYLKWLFNTSSGPVDCAIGIGGQFICTWRQHHLIIAITSSGSTDYSSSCKLLDLVASGLDFDGIDSSSMFVNAARPATTFTWTTTALGITISLTAVLLSRPLRLFA
eukprot:TRINITY_DN18083_c0_g1_i1.p1 TRINITY_DN18083_c0_g1~~TRINITY_DN18083_c0_g1_i1.p1  ORF type:complete len:399 (+),score=69.08 TRINITY_DN18083_c0_g1_i1:67-1263(+)